MIKSLEGDRTTAKKYAQDLILDALVQVDDGYWAEHDFLVQQMTEKEVKQVQEQIWKEVDRIRKRYGYMPKKKQDR